MTKLSEEILQMFAERGDLNYGEDVTQLEHALQCAHLAQEEQASDSLVLAALLHDIGHLLAGSENLAESERDDFHEDLGGRWLREHYDLAVSEPVRLHVAAKRYICAVNPAYIDHLSEASRLSLELQGGPMSAEEVQEFEANPYYKEAIRLRNWDDEGKKEVAAPGLGSYVELMDRLVVG